VQTAEELIEVR